MIFDLEGDSSVSWDWWVDPLSPISLLSEEFKSIVRAPDDSDFENLKPLWICSWPIVYKAFLRNAFYRGTDRHEQIGLQVERDDLRRFKKRERKAARKMGSKKRCRMPGSWKK